jgi:hypothetical protein
MTNKNVSHDCGHTLVSMYLMALKILGHNGHNLHTDKANHKID